MASSRRSPASSPPEAPTQSTLLACRAIPKDGTGSARWSAQTVSWEALWPALKRLGWKHEERHELGRTAHAFFPPGVNRENGVRRIDFFDSRKAVLTYLSDAGQLPTFRGAKAAAPQGAASICETCSQKHDGSYGTGRFCTKSCAAHTSITKEHIADAFMRGASLEQEKAATLKAATLKAGPKLTHEMSTIVGRNIAYRFDVTSYETGEKGEKSISWEQGVVRAALARWPGWYTVLFDDGQQLDVLLTGNVWRWATKKRPAAATAAAAAAAPATPAPVAAAAAGANAAKKRKLVCETCSQKHDGSYGAGRFCAKSCAARRNCDLKKCEKCGSRHDGTYGGGRFCTKPCAAAHAATRKWENREGGSKGGSKGKEYSCEMCEKKHVGDYGSGRFCDQSCHSSYAAKERSKKMALRDACESCGKLQDNDFGSGRFCDQSCQGKYAAAERERQNGVKADATNTGKFVCETCARKHDGSYGVGRFCSKSCAASFDPAAKRAASICETCSQKHDGSYGTGRFCTKSCAARPSIKNEHTVDAFKRGASLKKERPAKQKVERETLMIREEESRRDLSDPERQGEEDLSCPKCGKVLATAGGRTMHVRFCKESKRVQGSWRIAAKAEAEKQEEEDDAEAEAEAEAIATVAAAKGDGEVLHTMTINGRAMVCAPNGRPHKRACHGCYQTKKCRGHDGVQFIACTAPRCNMEDEDESADPLVSVVRYYCMKCLVKQWRYDPETMAGKNFVCPECQGFQKDGDDSDDDDRNKDEDAEEEQAAISGTATPPGLPPGVVEEAEAARALRKPAEAAPTEAADEARATVACTKAPRWSRKEDQELRQMVEDEGAGTWTSKSERFSTSRPGAGLRLRWRDLQNSDTLTQREAERVVDEAMQEEDEEEEQEEQEEHQQEQPAAQRTSSADPPVETEGAQGTSNVPQNLYTNPFAAAVHTYIKDQGMSQDALGSRTGLSQQRISGWLFGKCSASMHEMVEHALRNWFQQRGVDLERDGVKRDIAAEDKFKLLPPGQEPKKARTANKAGMESDDTDVPPGAAAAAAVGRDEAVAARPVRERRAPKKFEQAKEPNGRKREPEDGFVSSRSRREHQLQAAAVGEGGPSDESIAAAKILKANGLSWSRGSVAVMSRGTGIRGPWRHHKSILAASRDRGFNTHKRAQVAQCCNGEIAEYKGFVFKYANPAYKSEHDSGFTAGDHSAASSPELEGDGQPEAPAATTLPSARQDGLIEAPVFYPTEEEFLDLMGYIESIRAAAEKFGICNIVPPSSWESKLHLDPELKFQAGKQKLHMAPPPGHPVGFKKSKRLFTKESFASHAAGLARGLYGEDLAALGEQSPDDTSALEAQFWSLAEQHTAKEKAWIRAKAAGLQPGSLKIPESLYGSDIISTGHDNGTDWNLCRLAGLSDNILHYVSYPIHGVNTPMLYFGMLFSRFCWHVEDDDFNSISYLHEGAPKSWWGVPSSSSEQFERIFREEYAEHIQDNPSLRYAKGVMLNPSKLLEAGLPVSHLTHRPGTFVVTFPHAYHCGFNHGVNVAEAVNFAGFDWLKHGFRSMNMYREVPVVKSSVLTIEKLLCDMARHARVLSTKLADEVYRHLEIIAREYDTVLSDIRANKTMPIELPNAPPDSEDLGVMCSVCNHHCYVVGVHCSRKKAYGAKEEEQWSCVRHCEMLRGQGFSKQTCWVFATLGMVRGLMGQIRQIKKFQTSRPRGQQQHCPGQGSRAAVTAGRPGNQHAYQNLSTPTVGSLVAVVDDPAVTGRIDSINHGYAQLTLDTGGRRAFRVGNLMRIGGGGAVADQPLTSTNVRWTQCCALGCERWHELPIGYPIPDEGAFLCKMNTWNPNKPDCVSMDTGAGRRYAVPHNPGMRQVVSSRLSPATASSGPPGGNPPSFSLSRTAPSASRKRPLPGGLAGALSKDQGGIPEMPLGISLPGAAAAASLGSDDGMSIPPQAFIPAASRSLSNQSGGMAGRPSKRPRVLNTDQLSASGTATSATSDVHGGPNHLAAPSATRSLGNESMLRSAAELSAHSFAANAPGGAQRFAALSSQPAASRSLPPGAAAAALNSQGSPTGSRFNGALSGRNLTHEHYKIAGALLKQQFQGHLGTLNFKHNKQDVVNSISAEFERNGLAGLYTTHKLDLWVANSLQKWRSERSEDHDQYGSRLRVPSIPLDHPGANQTQGPFPRGGAIGQHSSSIYSNPGVPGAVLGQEEWMQRAQMMQHHQQATMPSYSAWPPQAAFQHTAFPARPAGVSQAAWEATMHTVAFLKGPQQAGGTDAQHIQHLQLSQLAAQQTQLAHLAQLTQHMPGQQVLGQGQQGLQGQEALRLLREAQLGQLPQAQQRQSQPHRQQPQPQQSQSQTVTVTDSHRQSAVPQLQTQPAVDTTSTSAAMDTSEAKHTTLEEVAAQSKVRASAPSNEDGGSDSDQPRESTEPPAFSSSAAPATTAQRQARDGAAKGDGTSASAASVAVLTDPKLLAATKDDKPSGETQLPTLGSEILASADPQSLAAVQLAYQQQQAENQETEKRIQLQRQQLVQQQEMLAAERLRVYQQQQLQMQPQLREQIRQHQHMQPQQPMARRIDRVERDV